MEFKDYYKTLGVEKTASADEIKRAYRKLARKYHPDVSEEPDAESRFKEVNEAHEALGDPEKRAAYDEAAAQLHAMRAGQQFRPPPDWGAGYEFSGGDGGDGDAQDFSEFFESLFGRRASAGARGGAGAHGRGAQGRGAQGRGGAQMNLRGEDRHAKVLIELEDSYHGAQRSLSLRAPMIDDEGRVVFQERQLDVRIPRGIRAGQHLRLAGQGGPGLGSGPAGDLYLEIEFRPHARYRVEDRDVYVDVPVAPWELALGAPVEVATPDGSVQLSVPAGSADGRKLRLRGKGLPSEPPGDLYVVLNVVLPPADTPAAREAYRQMAERFPQFDPRK
ncbi:MAG: DnaJ C-terminal domain-containing protein [Burkholderiaceae bacterium]